MPYGLRRNSHNLPKLYNWVSKLPNHNNTMLELPLWLLFAYFFQLVRTNLPNWPIPRSSYTNMYWLHEPVFHLLWICNELYKLYFQPTFACEYLRGKLPRSILCPEQCVYCLPNWLPLLHIRNKMPILPSKLLPVSGCLCCQLSCFSRSGCKWSLHSLLNEQLPVVQ
jgi:hypothetical protein